MSERIKRVIAEHGARVKSLDDERKEVEREIRDRETRLRAIDMEREKEAFAIRTLEEALDESEREKSWTAQHRIKKPGDPLSIVVQIEQALENHTDGLKLPALLAEMRKRGFQTDSKDPIAVLTSSLHRRKDLFARRHAGHRGRLDVHWRLKKYERSDSLAESSEHLFRKIAKGEYPDSPPTPNPVPTPLRRVN